MKIMAGDTVTVCSDNAARDWKGATVTVVSPPDETGWLIVERSGGGNIALKYYEVQRVAKAAKAAQEAAGNDNHTDGQ